VLVTGSSGFIGKALCAELLAQGWRVRVALRSSEERGGKRVAGPEYIVTGEISPGTVWENALKGMNVVVHLAARVHIMHDTASDPQAEFRMVNVAGTLNCARQAADAGVKRFIYLSSIKVNGETSSKPFTEEDLPDPQDAYAVSKWEAEQCLHELAEQVGLEVVIIRSPLVYGPGVKANFKTMMQWLNRDMMPLPLANIRNRRSLVALDNLLDMIAICLDHPNAANQTFFVADGEDMSTTELLERMAMALGRPARLFSVSQNILETGLRFIGKGDVAQRLCCSLQVDIAKVSGLLGWAPPVSVNASLEKTARHFLDSQSQ